MTPPLILPLSQCIDVGITGGKAVGLARLIAAGFSVPPGLCITTAAYEQALRTAGIQDLDPWPAICPLPEIERRSTLSSHRNQIKRIDISQLASQCLAALKALNRPSNVRWAVRSSATNEDSTHTSFAGLYRTHLGLPLPEIEGAIKDLWISLWEERVVGYMVRQKFHAPPRMAVLIQPMVDARTAGVGYAIHPVTGRRNQVMINAIPGLAAPLVDGTIAPDQYVVKSPMMGNQSPFIHAS
ncbi:hypothetical protein YTPLAS72_29300 [Nitrospira sp.]|nr:hypothetical protein YTPLAS72_29300 [Nitrospira sp.]